jgi:hypothetical protein
MTTKKKVMKPKLRRYWSGIRNVHGRMIRNDKTGITARKAYYERTGDKKFKESNYQKALKKGRVYTVNDVRGGNSTINKNREKALRKEHKRLLKKGAEGVPKNFKEFKKANPEQDFDEIQELFNSPT